MCEFCSKHGEGKKWYLNTKNYSHDLLSDLKRKTFIQKFYQENIVKGEESLLKLKKIFKNGKKVPSFIASRFSSYNKEMHYGQVIPLEDVRTILEMSTSIARIACGCRWAAKKKEERCCFLITIDPTLWYEDFDLNSFGNPDLSRFESMTADQAMETVTRYDRHGFIHSVWTFMTPFVGAICNCNMEDCLATRYTHEMEMSMMFRAEYVADIVTEKCSGCRKCEQLCALKCIVHDPKDQKCYVDKTGCYGCGVCRSSCDQDAITLKNRSEDPVAAHLW